VLCIILFEPFAAGWAGESALKVLATSRVQYLGRHIFANEDRENERDEYVHHHVEMELQTRRLIAGQIMYQNVMRP